LNSTTPTRSSSFTATLTTTGNTGAVGFTTTTAPPGSTGGIKVSRTGVVTTTGALSVGTYAASGTDSDSYGDTGTWSYSLKVSPTAITQLAPTTGTTTTGKSFTGQLKISGSHGTVTYAQSTGAPRLTVSSSGKVSAPATLVAGAYKATGSARDTLGDTGTWSFALTVTATKITQVAPATAMVATGKAFTGQLKVSGSHGTVTYAQSTGALDLRVSSSGKISVAATLVAGTYKATGTARDNLGDTGTWSFALRVVATKLTQVAPDTAVNRAGKAFTGQLRVSGSHGTVTYAQSAGAPHLKVSSSGKISAAAGLAAGIYKAKGTAKDTYGATGTWTFALTVKGSKLTQIAPTTGTTTAGKAFTVKLGVTGSHGTVTFIQSSTGAQILTVLPSGTLLAPDIYTPGTYKITGTVKDSLGDIGTWSFTLTVEAAALP
jgi:putative sterol carrier protein